MKCFLETVYAVAVPFYGFLVNWCIQCILKTLSHRVYMYNIMILQEGMPTQTHVHKTATVVHLPTSYSLNASLSNAPTSIDPILSTASD